MRFDERVDAHAVPTEGEDDRPEYRVSFWSERDGTWLNEYVGITEADVDEVLAWVEQNANGQHFTLWARSVWDGGQVLDVRLLGAEPHDVNGGREPSWARRARQDRDATPRT